jgi:hypothetical protein
MNRAVLVLAVAAAVVWLVVGLEMLVEIANA